LALASLLSLGACADVDGAAAEFDEEGDSLAQVDTAPVNLGPIYPSPVTTERADLGKGNGRDVVTIGDSWMNYFITSGGIEGALDRLAGPLGVKYRHYGVAGVEMLAGNLLGQPIPTQFDAAVRQNRDIKTVIMTGGGNDVLISGPADCRAGGPQCRAKLVRIKDAIVALWEKMAKAGVQDVIYIGYSEGAGNGAAPAEFANAMKNGVGEACLAMTTIRCHVVESTPIVNRRLAGDGIHPAPVASDDLAKAIVKLMADQGIRR
jgi:hypothetical protein